MNVLITGASGLLGRAVVAEFKNNSWKVLGLANTRARGDLVLLNILDFRAVRDIVKDFKPHAIIHCAAERSPDKCEEYPKACRRLNVDVSIHLAELAREINAVFIFISTDYVFSGETPPYKEEDSCEPLNHYGVSKYEAELGIMKCNPDGCILRIPVLYGDEEYIGESAVSSIIKLLLKEEPTNISNFEIRFPSHTTDIASIIFQLVAKKLKDPTINSIFHWCGMEPFTKYEMAKVIAEVYSRSYAHLIPNNDPSPGVSRPKNVQLSSSRLENLGVGQHTRFAEGVRSFKNFFD